MVEERRKERLVNKRERNMKERGEIKKRERRRLREKD